MFSFNKELDELVDRIEARGRNDEEYKTMCVRGIERIIVWRREYSEQTEVKGTSSRFGEGIWNQKRAKFESSCSGCGTFITIGMLCWITVGESPRCIQCGRPIVQPSLGIQ